jgi:hypothetical protein
MMTDIFIVILLVTVCFIFWQQRRQAELAKLAATRKCKELNLQLLSVALKAHRFKSPTKKWFWHSEYNFEFSSMGDDCYQGTIIFQGFTVVDIILPPHRV